ncbi:DUF4231 domain-containing protein [Streptomyces prunicolor]|uniref:DUF4231 domain-containing protein n=1 Tax=Streptomyces prunicolor TaxID=67348 RepID=UPI002250E119|nr:DUF4231 domain-containing protein [Streptomyces prunicolor]MCX5233823.1 DUF4231 domain-containing protein [Streptomyces prunicolor]
MGSAEHQAGGGPTDTDLPPHFVVNDRLALERQSESFNSVRVQLVVLLLATVVAMLAEHLPGHAMSALAAVLYALTIALGLCDSWRRPRAHWQAHRAAAEILRSAAWQYMAHGGPYHAAAVEPEALFGRRLEERLRELRRVGWQDVRDDAQLGSWQITDGMRAIRSRPFVERRDLYVRERLRGQLDWYRDRAARTRRAAARWSALTAVLTLCALVAAVLRAFGVLQHWDLTGLLSAAAAAGVAWQEARRHRPLTYAYKLIERDLTVLEGRLGAMTAQGEWAEAVAEVERIVSPQHTDWLARFGS